MMSMAEESGVEKAGQKKNYWFFSTVGLVVVLGIFIALFFMSSTAMVTLNSQEAAENAVDYINNYLLSGTTASLVSVEDVGNFYQLKIAVSGSVIESYVTKDGIMFFPSGFDLTETPETETEPEPSDEIEKTETPEAHAFVMSYCPYGLQFLKAYVPVIE